MKQGYGVQDPGAWSFSHSSCATGPPGHSWNSVNTDESRILLLLCELHFFRHVQLWTLQIHSLASHTKVPWGSLNTAAAQQSPKERHWFGSKRPVVWPWLLDWLAMTDQVTTIAPLLPPNNKEALLLPTVETKWCQTHWTKRHEAPAGCQTGPFDFKWTEDSPLNNFTAAQSWQYSLF